MIDKRLQGGLIRFLIELKTVFAVALDSIIERAQQIENTLIQFPLIFHRLVCRRQQHFFRLPVRGHISGILVKPRHDPRDNFLRLRRIVISDQIQ
jgi:hypothetical protein